MLATLNLLPDAADFFTNGDFWDLKKVINQLKACKNCNGQVPYSCYKFTAYEDGDRVKFKKDRCVINLEYKQKEKTKNALKSGVPYIFRNARASDFNITSQNEAAVDAAESAIFDDESFYFCGKCGVGKTLLASIIVNERARIDKESLFLNAPDMFASLRDFNSKKEDFESPEEKLYKICKVKCLIIDDLGAEKNSDWTCEQLFRILNERYNNARQTIITSNLTPEKLIDHFKDINGERIVRRILHICKTIFIKE